MQDGAVLVALRYKVLDGHEGGAGSHQQAAQPDDSRTVESVPKVAEEDDEDAVTDLGDGETDRGSDGFTTVTRGQQEKTEKNLKLLTSVNFFYVSPKIRNQIPPQPEM